MSEDITILVFSMGGDLYGMPISAIRVLESMVPSTSIHGSPRHLMGVANLRGQIISIVDIEQIYNIESIDYDKEYLVVLKSMSQLFKINYYHFNDKAIENQDILALRVGNIIGMETFQKSHLETELLHLEEHRRPFVWGILKTERDLVTVFNPASILQFCQNTLFF
jgi:chemotaxis signal transduction protein